MYGFVFGVVTLMKRPKSTIDKPNNVDIYQHTAEYNYTAGLEKTETKCRPYWNATSVFDLNPITA